MSDPARNLRIVHEGLFPAEDDKPLCLVGRMYTGKRVIRYAFEPDTNAVSLTTEIHGPYRHRRYAAVVRRYYGRSRQ